MRQTPQREGILQVLSASERALTVEEIHERMEDGRSGIPTIYRNLVRFIKEGWVEQVQGADLVMRFLRCQSRQHHHHLQCETCGRTVEVESCGVEAMVADLEARSGFRVTRHQLHLFGTCPQCKGVDKVPLDDRIGEPRV
ncbi:MAG: transcriptional repressor [Acidobacteria bacterium]|nr:transcriptional repressor [Acidobacteriota bacterium]